MNTTEKRIVFTVDGILEETTSRVVLENPEQIQQRMREATADATNLIILDRVKTDEFNGTMFRVTQGENISHLMVVHQKSLRVRGSWIPTCKEGEDTPSGLIYSPYTDNPHALVMWKEIPLKHWLLIEFTLDGHAEAWKRRATVLNEIYLCTTSEMNGVETETPNAAILPNNIPNLYANGRYCTGALGFDYDSKKSWVENTHELVTELRNKPSNGDLSNSNEYWSCDENLELTIDMNLWLRNSAFVSNRLVNLIGDKLQHIAT